MSDSQNSSNRTIGYFPASFFKRSNRIISNHNGYYYKVREGTSIGPFNTQATALLDLNQFIATFSKHDYKLAS